MKAEVRCLSVSLLPGEPGGEVCGDFPADRLRLVVLWREVRRAQEFRAEDKGGRRSPIPVLGRTRLPVFLHLATLRDNDVLRRLVVVTTTPDILDFLHDVHAVDDFAEDDVFAVEEGRGGAGDEELAAVGVGAGVLRDWEEETWVST